MNTRNDANGSQDFLSLLAAEMGEPHLRRDVVKLVHREIADPALRTRVIELLERDATTLEENELEMLASVVSGVLEAHNQRLGVQSADATLPHRDPFWPKGWPRPRALAGMGFLAIAFGLSARWFAAGHRRRTRVAWARVRRSRPARRYLLPGRGIAP